MAESIKCISNPKTGYMKLDGLEMEFNESDSLGDTAINLTNDG